MGNGLYYNKIDRWTDGADNVNQNNIDVTYAIVAVTINDTYSLLLSRTNTAFFVSHGVCGTPSFFFLTIILY